MRPRFIAIAALMATAGAAAAFADVVPVNYPGDAPGTQSIDKIARQTQRQEAQPGYATTGRQGTFAPRGCRDFATYDPAHGTYVGEDGETHFCG